MSSNGWKAYIRSDELGRGVLLHVAKQAARGTDVLVAVEDGKATLKRIEDGEYRPDPFLAGDVAEEVLQALMDAAWAYGMRPNGISGERGEIKRLEEHLSDIRAIAFHKIGAPKP